ncbi:hypothetical protein V1511DRAFT_503511 [Dipodascopsis uninucleata]
MVEKDTDGSITMLEKIKALELPVALPFGEEISRLLGEVGSSKDRDELLNVAVSSLNSFLQHNFTGPPLNSNVLDTLINNGRIDSKVFAYGCIEELSIDSEGAYPHTEFPFLLIVCERILEYLISIYGDDKKFISQSKLWLARSSMVHQSLLRNPSNSLHDRIFECFAACVPSDDISKSERAEYFLELARANIFYSYDSEAKKAIEDGQKLSGLHLMLTGIKAKRTKFQQRDIAGLVVLARSSDDDDIACSAPVDMADVKQALPQALPLNSDLLLEAPAYVAKDEPLAEDIDDEKIPQALRTEDPNSPSILKDIDNCILLLTLTRIKENSPSNSPLVVEQLQAYVTRIVRSATGSSSTAKEQKINWTIFSRALWDRSLLESKSAKTVERGTLQLASLVDELGAKTTGTAIVRNTDEEGIATAAERLRYIHVLPLMPKWHMNLTLADQWVSLGMIKSAQEIYEQLDLPIENALCMAMAESRDEAVKVLKDYVKKEPVDIARALSVLGDITQEPEYWYESWEKGRYAGAKRSLGEYYFKKGQAEDSIIHLSDSLKINPLNRNAWFLYGCAGLESQQYELAAEGFTRCISMEKDDAKAWANLATALLHLNQQQTESQTLEDDEEGGIEDFRSSDRQTRRDRSKEALSALTEACRLNPTDWRLWNNLIVISAKLENWSTALRATMKLIEIRGPKEGECAIDIGVLKMLAQILVSDIYGTSKDDLSNGADSTKYSFFERQAVSLFTETLPKLITRTPELWELVAKVELWRKRPWNALDAYEKQFRLSLTTFESDETNEVLWKQAVNCCDMLIDAYINFGQLPGKYAGEGGDENSVVCKDWKWKARNSIRSIMAKGRKIWLDSPGWNKLLDLQEELKG